MNARDLLTVDQRAAIGDIAIESAWLDSIAAIAIMVLTKLEEPQARALLRGKMLDGKLQLLAELGEIVLPEAKRDAFHGIVGRLRELNRDRVTVIHGTWQPKGGFTLAVLAKSGIGLMDEIHLEGRKERMLSTEEVEALAGRLSSTTHELWKLIVAFAIESTEQQETGK
jgi:hypothetical protein